MPVPMAPAMATRAHTADSMPDDRPLSTTVAGPVRADLAMSRTGLPSVEVKFWVILDTTNPSTTPTTMAPNMRAPRLLMARPSGLPTYTNASTPAPTMDSAWAT